MTSFFIVNRDYRIVKFPLDKPAPPCYAENTKSNMTQYFLCDKYGSSIFKGQTLKHGNNLYKVIQDRDLGLCIEDIKTHSIEMLTQEMSHLFEIVDERIYA